MSLATKAGNNLRSLIAKKNITQEKAAEMIGISERQLRRYLKEGIDSITTIEIIAREFNVDVITLFE